jgi:transmembrane sensor
MTKNEFLSLYEKFLRGQCTAAEKDLLEAYNDEMMLSDEQWSDDLGNSMEISTRIWNNLQSSRVSQTTEPKSKYVWFKIAAVLVVAVTAGFLFFKINKPANPIISKASIIHPGGNKAYLTMANGARIILNNVQTGQVISQRDVQVSKTKDGLIVYHVNPAHTESKSLVTEYNTITTPYGGQYEVVLEDGSKIMLNAASSLRFPVNFVGATRQVDLTGEAYFEIAHNKAKPFTVHANGVDVKVLGTHFNINAYKDNPGVTTTLLQGSVQMRKGTETVMLVPGQEGSALQGESKITVKTADIEETMGWKNGMFVFHDENLVNVMAQVSRWYDVEIQYVGEIKEIELGGSVSKYKNITDLLNNMELTRAIHYKVEGRRVIIMK